MDIASGTHQIGPANGQVRIKTYKDGLGAKLAHDLVLVANAWSGTVNVDADNPAASSATVSLDPDGIDIVEATGGVKDLSDKDRKTIKKNITKDILHGPVTLQTTSVSGQAPNFTVAGNMTINGTTRPVNVAVAVNGTTVTAAARISQADFGIKPYSAMLGAIKLRDDVEFEFEANLPAG